MLRASLLILCGCLVIGCSKAWDREDDNGIPILKVPVDIAEEQEGSIGKTSAALTKWGCEKMSEAFKEHIKREIVDRTQASFASAWRQKERCEEREKRYYADAGMYPSDNYYNSMNTTNSTNAANSYNSANNTDPDPEHSETNNQVAGVDEADIVKTDGKHIYLLSNGALRIIKSWPAEQSEELAKVKIAGTPKKLFVYEDRVLVYASGKTTSNEYDYYNDYYYDRVTECTYGYGCVPTGDGYPTWITIFDISDRAAPKKVREIKLTSSLLAARRIGSAIHTVVTEPSRHEQPLNTFDFRPYNLSACEMSKNELYYAFVELLAENLEKAELLDTPDFFPSSEDTAGDDPFAACKSLYRSSLGDGSHYTSVISLDLTKNEPLSAVTIFSQPGVVYASKESLYLSVPRIKSYSERYGWYEGMDDVSEATAIHKFALSNDAASASYEASGMVKGRLLNQFSLDEYEGYLRVASTVGHIPSSTNALSVLEHKRDQLQVVGLLDKLAPTEDIRSVRFDGEKGYVVTFKKTDPLFVLDLSTPTDPAVLGELKIPGFSTYMHKMDDDHLLTIGYDADDQGSFAWFQGVALQIFDVTDPTDPKLKHKHVIGTRGSSSEALTDHLAFTYYPPKNLLSLPITVCEGAAGGGDYGDAVTFSGLMLFNTTTTDGFKLKGQVSHPLSEGFGCGNRWTDASSQVKRSLIIDNFVYSISNTLLKVNDLDNPSQDVVALSFE